MLVLLAVAALAGGQEREHRRPRREKKKDLVKTCIASGAWMAYLKNPDGDLMPVRDTQSDKDDNDWLGLRFVDFNGPHIRLGVMQVENRSADHIVDEWNRKLEVPVASIEEMMSTALFNTKRFDIIERKRIQLILGEQSRKEAFEPTPKELYRAGKVLGIQYLVYGVVNEWVADRGSKGGGFAFFSSKKQEAEVAMTFSVADITNAQVLFTTTERARVGEWSMSFADGQGGSGGSTQRTPTNYAVQVCVNKAAFKIAAWMKDRKWKGAVINIKGPDYYINAGAEQGMRQGMTLTLFSLKGLVVDGMNGVVLGEDLRAIGNLEVTVAQPGYSIARPTGPIKGVKQYDRVELASPPSPPPAPPGCMELVADIAT